MYIKFFKLTLIWTVSEKHHNFSPVSDFAPASLKTNNLVQDSVLQKKDQGSQRPRLILVTISFKATKALFY
jgi:hypothetical protein